MLRVLSIRGKTLGEDNTNIAAILTNLGNLYMRRGDYGTAVKMYERAIGIRERIFSADDLSLAPPLSGLSTVYYLRGDYAGSIKPDKRVLAIKEKNLKPDHPDIANALSNLALNYTNTSDFESAEPLYKRARTIDEKNFGSESPDYATAEFNYAIQYLRRGDYEKARPLYEHSLIVAQKNREGEPLNLAIFDAGFGEFCIAAGDYDRAEKLLTEALEIREKILGPEHEDVGLACDLLVKLYALKGNPSKALEFQTRAAAINEKNIALNLSIGTEHQKLSYMTGAAKDLNQTIVLQSMLPKNNEIVNSLAVTGVLQQKGRVLDAVSSSMSVLRQRAAPGDQGLFDKLNDTNARLSELELNGAPDLPYDQRKKQIATLQEIKDKVETDISKVTAGYFERSQPVTLSSIQSEIPADSVLVEFASYSPIAAKPPLNDDRSYVAYVILGQGRAQWIELGTCVEIDKMVVSLRSALSDAKRGDVKSLARRLIKR